MFKLQLMFFSRRRPVGIRGNLEGLSDEGVVEENFKVAKRLIGHQSGKERFSI